MSLLAGIKQHLLQESGFPLRLPDILNQQREFDRLVDATNCTGASDRLACLRAVPYDQFMAAIALPSDLFLAQLNVSFLPMIDGKLLQGDPLALLQSGKYAKVFHTVCFTYRLHLFHRFHS